MFELEVIKPLSASREQVSSSHHKLRLTQGEQRLKFGQPLTASASTSASKTISSFVTSSRRRSLRRLKATVLGLMYASLSSDECRAADNDGRNRPTSGSTTVSCTATWDTTRTTTMASSMRLTLLTLLQSPSKPSFQRTLQCFRNTEHLRYPYSTYFHDHWKTSLVGHSDSNGDEDTGHLRITYANNYWENCGSRGPSLRFGTGHVYNSYYKK